MAYKTFEERALEINPLYQHFIDSRAREEAERQAKKEEEKSKVAEKEIISVKWVDYDNSEKERKQTLSNEWVSLRIATNGFLKGDGIKIKIEEIDGKLEKDLTAKKGKDDILIVKKAFKFDKKNANNTNRVVKVAVSYEDKSVEGEYVLKENNGGIWGVRKNDATKVIEDIKIIFSDKRFSEFISLIQIDRQDNKHIAYIDVSDLANVLQNLSNNEDKERLVDYKCAVEMVANTINSEKKFTVEYLNYTETGTVSSAGTIAIDEYYNKKGITSILTKDNNVLVKTITVLGGEGYNVPTKDGSHSFIISDVPNIKIYKRAVTFGHEVCGHGIPSSRNESDEQNNTNAIRTDNLIRRLLKLTQRDGSDHAGGKVEDPYKLPYTK